MSKPNPSLSIKFTQIHRGKTCFSCEYQEPCAFTWCFYFFEDRERWVKGHLLVASVSVWDRSTRPSQQLHWLGPQPCCAWGPVWGFQGWKPDSPWAVSTVARLLVPKLTSSRLGQKFQYNAAPHLKQILFSMMEIVSYQSRKQDEWWWEWDRKAVRVVEYILAAKERQAGWGQILAFQGRILMRIPTRQKWSIKS